MGPVALVALVLATVASASDVIVLTDKNFDGQLAQGSWLVDFFAPWCGHCKTLAPIFSELATELKGKVNLGSVNCDEEVKLRDQFEINGYPTLKLFHEGQIVEYQGRRTIPNFVEFLKKQGALKPQASPSAAGNVSQPAQVQGKGLATPIKLRYFSLRGRAESIRLLLEEVGAEYEDIRMSTSEWPAIKKAGIASGELPFGQVPALTTGDLKLVQSGAILRHIARAYGLYGNTPEETTRIDMVLGGCEDVRQKYSAVAYSSATDFPEKKATYLRDTLPEWLRYFENLLRANMAKGGGLFFIGSSLTLADIDAFDVLSLQVGLDKDALSPYPLLHSFWRSIGSRPRLATYLNSSRRQANPNGDRAAFGNAANPENRESNPLYVHDHGL